MLSKGMCERLREMTGSSLDGQELITFALGRDRDSKPALQLNDLATDTDWNEQLGCAHLARGLWARYRNPTAHETRLKREMARPILEREMLEVLTTVSLVHHGLDGARP